MAAGAVTAAIITNDARACAINGGTSDRVVIADNLVFDRPETTGALTLEGWVYIRAVNNAYPLFLERGGGTEAYRFGLNSTARTIYFVTEHPAANSVISTTSLALRTWHHVVCTWDKNDTGGANKKIYIDGVVDVTTGNVTDNLEGTGIITLGSHLDGTVGNFEGYMKNIKLYEVALTQKEITQAYQGKNITRGLIGHWKLESDFNDSSGFGNHGTANGTYISNGDGAIAKQFASTRISSGDIILTAGLIGNQIVAVHIEES